MFAKICQNLSNCIFSLHTASSLLYFKPLNHINPILKKNQLIKNSKKNKSMYLLNISYFINTQLKRQQTENFNKY